MPLALVCYFIASTPIAGEPTTSPHELREALNKAFAEMRADGTYDKLAKKYFDFNVYGG